MHRIEWIRSKVSLEDRILDVGSADNSVFSGWPGVFRPVSLDKSVRPDEHCLPDVIALAEALPFKEHSFDIVCMNELLEHVADPQKVLKEGVRVASKKIIVTCPDEFHWSPELKPFWNPGHVRFYNKESFQKELQHLNLPFQMEDIKYGPWAWFGAEVYCDKEKVMDYPQKLRDFFESDRYWNGDWGYRQGYQDFPIHKQIVDLIVSRKPKSVLDVGCAWGFIPLHLRERGIDAWGIDISEYAISHAPEAIKPYLKVASATEIPFPDKHFDLIYCASVLEHIPEELTDKVIAEFKRVANRAILGIAYQDPYSALDIHSDISHVNIHDEVWWRQKLPPEFEMVDVCVEDGKPYTRGLTKINLGCFGDYYPTWLNVDILLLRPILPPHIRFRPWDLNLGIPWQADNSVDLYRMSHLIEHLTLEKAQSLLREIYRTLKPGGVARISTPDGRIILKHHANSDMAFFNPIQPPEFILAPTEGERLSRILFSGDYAHRALYEYSMLKSFLEQAGFRQIHRASPGFSDSTVMQAETIDQHIEISLVMEVIK